MDSLGDSNCAQWKLIWMIRLGVLCSGYYEGLSQREVLSSAMKWILMFMDWDECIGSTSGLPLQPGCPFRDPLHMPNAIDGGLFLWEVVWLIYLSRVRYRLIQTVKILTVNESWDMRDLGEVTLNCEKMAQMIEQMI